MFVNVIKKNNNTFDTTCKLENSVKTKNIKIDKKTSPGDRINLGARRLQRFCSFESIDTSDTPSLIVD